MSDDRTLASMNDQETVDPPRRRHWGVPRRASESEDAIGHPLLTLPAVLFVAAVFFLPAGVLAVYSLWPTVDGQIIHDWTLANYRRVLGGVYVRTLIRTFWFVGLCSLITVAATLPFAYFVATKVRPRWRIYWILIAVMPFWTSYLIRVFTWQNLFGDTGIINDTLARLNIITEPLVMFGFGRPAIVLTFVYLLFPLSFLAAYITLERMDPSMLEASSDLGARPWNRLTWIILPMARTGLLAGFILSFITMIGDYVTPALIGGTSGLLYSNLIVNQFGSSLQWGFGAALALTLLVSVFVLLLLVRTAVGSVQSAGEYTRRYERHRAPFLFAYSLFFVAFLYVPIGLLLLFAINDSENVGFPFAGVTMRWIEAVFDNPVLIDAFWTSMRVAAWSVGLSVTLGTLAAIQLARSRGAWRQLSLATISVPLLLPPLVMGIAMIIGFNALGFDRGLWSIVIGHTIITLPIVTLLVLGRLEGVDRNMELAAMDLGAPPLKTFLRITLPQAAPAIIAAAMIAFAVSMDEFILTFLVTGTQTTLPLFIFGSIRYTISPELLALSALILTASFVVMLVGAFIAFGWERIGRPATLERTLGGT